MLSTMTSWPMRAPPRCLVIRYGAPVIDSIPPATMTSAEPAARLSEAIITACRPEPHILLTVVASTWRPRPAPIAACRAGAWPRPAGRTQPM